MKRSKKRRIWRIAVIIFVATIAVGTLSSTSWRQPRQTTYQSLPKSQQSNLAINKLKQLTILPAAPRDGYSRKQFSDGWAKVDACTVRDKIIARDMTEVRFRSPTDCTVVSGTLNDPYTGKTIHFIRGPGTSSAVQIDHVVAISDTWQTGAQRLTKSKREQLYNDSLELLAVDGPANEEKGDGDAAAWLPPNTDYMCRYVARQIAVKLKYHLWVTPPEHAAMEKVLVTCPGQLVPSVGE